MKTFTDILNEAKGQIESNELVPGFTFFVLSKNGQTVSRFKITGEVELNVGAVLNVKQGHVSGDKVPQDKISKDFVLGKKGDLQIFRSKKEAVSAFKRAGLNEKIQKNDRVLVKSKNAPNDGEYGFVTKIDGDVYTLKFDNKKSWSYNREELVG